MQKWRNHFFQCWSMFHWWINIRLAMVNFWKPASWMFTSGGSSNVKWKIKLTKQKTKIKQWQIQKLRWLIKAMREKKSCSLNIISCSHSLLFCSHKKYILFPQHYYFVTTTLLSCSHNISYYYTSLTSH
jgi:hypothetical protein